MTTHLRADEHENLAIVKNRSSNTSLQIPLDEICFLRPGIHEGAQFASTNYRIYVPVGVQSHELAQFKCLIDTSAGMNLVSKTFLHLAWTPRIKYQNFLMLKSANNQPVSSEVVILLHLQINDLHIRVWFGVVDNSVFDSLLGTSFISIYM